VLNKSDILQGFINEHMKIRALNRFNDMPGKSHRVYMTDAELKQGFESEVFFESKFPSAFRSQGKEVFLFDYRLNGFKVEIKNKGCGFMPSIEYEGSVSCYLYDIQIPDIYVFTRTSRTDNFIWIVGWMTRKEFDNYKWKLSKGDSTNNGLTPRTDTWNVYYKYCRPINTLLEYTFNTEKEKPNEIRRISRA
jgi:hypothetical protein